MFSVCLKFIVFLQFIKYLLIPKLQKASLLPKNVQNVVQNIQKTNKTEPLPQKPQIPPSSSSSSSSHSKSPMAAINDLARYNKLVALYELIATQGPPHSRKFAVRLTLNEQSWICEDTSIRKAQHACAAKAQIESNLPKPLPKELRPKNPPNLNKDYDNVDKAMTDTVKLNTLAMKLGLKTEYKLVSTKILGEAENSETKENKKPVSWREVTAKNPIIC